MSRVDDITMDRILPPPNPRFLTSPHLHPPSFRLRGPVPFGCSRTSDAPTRPSCVTSCFRYSLLLFGTSIPPCPVVVPPSISCSLGFIVSNRINTASLLAFYFVGLCGYRDYNLGLGPDSALARSRNCFLKIFPAALFGTWSMMTTPPLRNLWLDTRP